MAEEQQNMSGPTVMDIQSVRSRLVDRVFIFVAVFSPLALFLSLTRCLEHGWHPIYLSQIGAVAIVTTSAIFLKKISYRVRVFILLGFGILFGISGILVFGLVTGAYIVLFATAMLATIFFGTRAGLIALAVDIGIMAAAAIAICTGVKTFSFDISEYATSPTAWIIMITIFSFYVPLTILAMGIVYEHLDKSLVSMRESEKKYRVLFESADDAFFLMENDRIFDCNAKTLELFGVTPGQIIGRTPHEYSPPKQPDGRDSKESALEKIDAVLQGRPQFFEWQHCRRDGALFDAEVSLTDMSVEGNRYLLAIVRDITQRKMAEEEKKSIQKQLHIAQRMQAIGTLAGGIAHDFNNILSSILGFSGLVKYDLPEEDRESRENIESVIKAGLRAKALVQHILTFSRSAETQKGPVVPAILIKEAVTLLKATLPAAIDISVHVNDDHTAVFGDATQIHQVIMNLCINAAHAMKAEGGRLELRLEKKTLTKSDMGEFEAATPGDYLVLVISDTGKGMTEKLVDRIFDPFFTTKKRGEGTGMGLSVVHGIVKEMEGAIRVESEPGRGTVFHVLLPVYTGAWESTPAAAPGTPQSGKGRILFVDDDEDITDMACRALSRFGYEVTAMTDSTEAMEKFSSDPDAFDLVITDFSMPNMDGIELSRRILEKKPGVPIILCTGFSEAVSRQTLDDIGIHRMVMKPLILTDLADLVKDAITLKESSGREKSSDH